MVAMEVAAPKATDDPRDGIASRKDNVAANQTIGSNLVLVRFAGPHYQIGLEFGVPVLIGLWNRASTL